jgi:hypothetical protein
VPGLERVAAGFPLKAYADYPFRVCVNDQFDRFSAPLEWRFTAEEVEGMLLEAGFADVVVLANNGWIGSGRRPPDRLPSCPGRHRQEHVPGSASIE